MKGHIDRFNSTIAGWAFDPNYPGRAVEIVIEHNGHPIYRCTADFCRIDLLDAVGEENHGFSFDPTEEDGFTRNMHLSVFAVTDKKHLLHEGLWMYEGAVAFGEDEWLFLNTDSNQVNLRISAQVDIEAEKIHRTALLFAMREATLKQLGIPYRSLILPEKNVVCSQFLPGLAVSEMRPVNLIMEQLSRLNCTAIYPIDEFRGNASILFSKTDTHANASGYRLIFEIIRSELPELFGDVKLPSPVLNTKFCGDLGGKIRPVRIETVEEYAHPASAEHYYKHDNVLETIASGGRLRGQTIYVVNEHAKNRLLVFGTSSAYHALPLLSCGFAQTLMIWENTFDYRVIELFKPDCILWLPAERFLPTDLNDVSGLPATFQQVSKLMTEL
ncbi:hypothetical protein [Pseudoduganella umbonata]|uniref:AlgX/AlgJ SGNH hydrolase-like domain-containing protein n=1 Tax=Pseudoduganella umbonata TaxID=864828 RepID=A0A4P8HSD2_9BURK|nr:hypothetical protein [Pseudoduganella umbonata]MBB3225076.1 hypothetical protein [Pseudoduganella umbonata]QCP11454.1 hypothetical protein FCL38_14255 [Pseudoduganella umbonata]